MSTGKQICQEIQKWAKDKFDYIGTAEDIWNMSPTGELWPIFELYEIMKQDKERA